MLPVNKFRDEKALLGNAHWFSYRGRRFLLDVNTCAIFEIDEVVMFLLDLLALPDGDFESARLRTQERYSSQQVDSALAELEEWHRQGLFLGPDPAARAAGCCSAGTTTGLDYTNSNRAVRPSWTKALCLNVAHACNMRCRYCFAGQGSFGGGHQLMSIETGEAALDFLLDQAPAGADLEVDFFGGEPLLNLRLIEFVIENGLNKAASQGKNLRFTLTTNGLLLDREVVSFLNRHDVQLILSLDGRREVHDFYRPMPGGGGSYALVVDRMLDAVDSRKGQNYFIRGTYTRRNLDFTRDVAHLASLGFRQISLEPVVAGPWEDYSIQMEDLPVICAEYDNLVKFCLDEQQAGRLINFFHFQLDLEPGLCLPKRLNGCGAGGQYLAVAPDGRIYPCHQFVGREEFCLGSLDGGIANCGLQDQICSMSVMNKPCRNCWARYFCGGGCHAANLLWSGSLGTPYEIGCALVKKRLECAIFLQANAKN